MKISEIYDLFDKAIAADNWFNGIQRFYDREDFFETVDEKKEALETDAGSGVVLSGFFGEGRKLSKNREPIEMEATFYYEVLVQKQAKDYYEKKNPRDADEADDWRGKFAIQIAERLLECIKKNVCDCHSDVGLHDTPIVRVDNDGVGDPYFQHDVVFSVKVRY